jgi:hypothetical protein
MMAFSIWRPLIPAEIAKVPECPGVFELATLVRTVVFIGAAPESLASSLGRHLQTGGSPSVQAARLYFRYQASDDAEHAQRERLEEYRRTHGDRLPAAQSEAPPPRLQPRRHLKAL